MAQFTLEYMQQLAISDNKDLQAKRLAIKQTESELFNAGLLTPFNPELEIEKDSDILTTRSGEGSFQLSLSQEIELEGQRTYDVIVRLDDESRSDIDAIRHSLIDTPSGVKVPLENLASVVESKGPNVISRENSQRRIVISCNTSGRDLGSIISEIQRSLSAQVKLPPGYFITYGGQFESQQAATRQILLLGLLSLAGMVLVLYSHFNSMRIVTQILVNIPLALVGSIAAIFLTGGVLSVATLVGFITLTGIASRNTIMMISHYLHLLREEGESFNKEMVIRGSLERLVPVMMTALTAGLALIPLVLAKGEPGKEILFPVASVILGGLISSTLLDMAVTPAIFLKFGRSSAERYLKHSTEKGLE